MKVFCDTNIFITAFSQNLQLAKTCEDVISKNSVYLSQQIFLEFIRVASVPSLKLFPLEKAVDVINGFILKPNLTLLTQQVKTLHIWLDLQKKYPIKRNQIFDTYIVATMLTHGITKL